ncbi:hypothetical protein FJV46_10635 [Arthrobacter agilis]|nr:hypothetical protein B8W74_04655 [Arthrobacter agilis]PPB46544.1 hypothetical protein CI784_06950 [Arthrobacter agilis]TPV23801.1 hypothetical protein FJV46_10635 [Arthrobacter agilis]
MPRGGARVNSGPAADPQALRRDRPADKDSWTVLPSEGRKGNAPAWPLSKWRDQEKAKDPEERDDAGARALDARELVVWRQIWKTPQAAQWEKLGWKHDVALYVRMLVGAEQGNMKAASEARQWSDRLGLSQMAMLRNRWRIAADEVGARRTQQRPATQRPKSSRDRFRVVSSAGA